MSNMYVKLVVFLCVASLAKAAPKAQWPTPTNCAPQGIPALPYTSQAGPAATYGPVATYPGAPVLTKAYTGPTIASYSTSSGAKGSVPYSAGHSQGQTYTAVQYSAGPVASAKGSAPAVSYSYTTPAVQYSSAPSHSALQYSAGPAASTYQSVPSYSAGYPGAVAYSGAAGFPGDFSYPGAAAYTVPQYTGAAGYSAGGYSGYPGAAAYPNAQYTSVGAYPGAQTYTGAPAYTSGYSGYPSPIQYSSAPAVSRVSYSGLDGSYAW